jgi:hypothetical protein
MKRSELTNKQKLFVPCPICAAAIGKRCKMYSGFGRRNEPHSERKYYAIQAIEQDHAPVILTTPASARSGPRAPLGTRTQGAHYN